MVLRDNTLSSSKNTWQIQVTNHCQTLLIFSSIKSSQTARTGSSPPLSLSLSLSLSLKSRSRLNSLTVLSAVLFDFINFLNLAIILFYRYIEYNARSLDCVKAYHSSIPSFLKNKPRMLVDHCLKRIPPHVQPIPEENIQQKSAGKFQLKSVDSANTYDIDLCSPCPCCSCYDWQRYHLPCKHMLAVFHHFPSWDWEFLPSEYRDAPHFNLDLEILDSFQNTKPSTPSKVIEHIEKSKQQTPSTKIQRLTTGKPHKASLSPSSVEELSNKKDWLKCRELVKSIQRGLMNLCGINVSNILDQLQQVASAVKNIEPKDNDLPVLNPPKRRQNPVGTCRSKPSETNFLI